MAKRAQKCFWTKAIVFIFWKIIVAIIQKQLYFLFLKTWSKLLKRVANNPSVLCKSSLLPKEGSILKMGFAAASPSTSMASHVFLRSSHQKEVMLGSSLRKETWRFNLNLPKLNYQSRNSFCCKNESIDFEERTSPNEVNFKIPSLIFLFFGSFKSST